MKQKIKKLKALTKKQAKVEVAAFKRVNPYIQTLLLLWLCFRTETISHAIHRLEISQELISMQLQNVSHLFHNITETLSDQIVSAQFQFRMAIESILSLFGGSES